jgi:alkanesulfonate monooxygenase SsuD/methylene tetrahydromethanopterin reductase-like flavin-dependent oxidoreductase (luciferase family)
MVNSVVLRGIDGTKQAWTAYREARAEAGLPAPALDRFAYAGFVYVGDTDEEGVAVGSKLLWFLNTSLKQAPQFSKFLPGRMPPEMAPGVYRTKPRAGEAPVARPADALRSMTAEQAIQRQIMFAGNPETVTKQIMAAYDTLGGFGHLIFIGRSGFLTHEEAEKSIRLLAKEVMPRLPA